LHLALLAHGIGPGDEVITTPFTFVATANAIRYVGAQPVFADIEAETFNLDPACVEPLVTSRTRALIVVDLFGNPADMRGFVEIAARHGLILIEDCAQAHGAEVAGRRVGSFGSGCFSFYPTKNMTAGEGGMVTTNDPELAERLQVLRNHGMRDRYVYEGVGFNFRMTEMQAALGLAQLDKLEQFNQARIRNAAYLTSRLRERLRCPSVRPGTRHVFNQFTVRVPADQRDQIRAGLAESGIDSAVYYPRALSGEGAHPRADCACREVLSLPVHPGLSQNDLEHIASSTEVVCAAC
jgi:dTDP-4-amino-4,6-dideoxygalactose transaminase